MNESHIHCKKCKSGLMVPTAEVVNTKNTDKWVHKCNKCNHQSKYQSPF